MTRSKSTNTPATLPLRVGLDVRTWQMSGLGTYLRELLGGFAALELPVRWTLVGPEDEVAPRLPEGLDVECWINYDAPIYSRQAFWKYPDLGNVDLFHYPHYNLPRVRARRCVVTFFDLFHYHYGGWLKARYQKFFMQYLRWRRAEVITASEKSSLDLQQIGGIHPDRITSIALGPGSAPGAFEMSDLPENGPISLTGAPLSPPWFLVTGIDQPHKNFEFLLSAMSLYYQRRPDAPGLVWMGMNEESHRRWIDKLEAHARTHISLQPYCPRATFEQIYRQSLALLFPSLEEGFGLPPLEAMQRGIPVVCSRREPMTQLLGDACLYFDPHDSASLWRRLDQLLDSATCRDEMTERGLRCVQSYDWRHTAYKTFELYARTCGLDLHSQAKKENGPAPEQADPETHAPAVNTDQEATSSSTSTTAG